MLSVQRPRAMGPTQPTELPFGYNYDPNQEFLYLDAPEPPPGQPLLSDNESHVLRSFFEDMTSDNYSTANFGEGLNFSDEWLSLPPTFMGHTTSFGQQPPTTMESEVGLPGGFHELVSPSNLMPPPPPPPPQARSNPSIASQPSTPVEQQNPSADVLAAATLLQNGSMARTDARGQEAMFANPPQSVGHMRHPALADFSRAENSFSDLMFVPSGRSVPPAPSTSNPNASAGPTAPSSSSQRSRRPADVQWGSDTSFARPTFLPLSERETSESLAKERLAYMGCLEVVHNPSAATTRPPSPQQKVMDPSLSAPLRLRTRVPPTPIVVPRRDDDPAGEGPPRKRRKSKARADDEDGSPEESSSNGDANAQAGASAGPDPDPSTPAAAAKASSARKRKSKVDEGQSNGSQATAEPTPNRRRKSTVGTPGPPVSSSSSFPSKQPRENLSEEQKRSNHIKSEQKRRTVIKEGFEDLCELVPGLRAGGFSKSSMLNMAAEWLEDLSRGNDVLRARLEGLGMR